MSELEQLNERISIFKDLWYSWVVNYPAEPRTPSERDLSAWISAVDRALSRTKEQLEQCLEED